MKKLIIAFFAAIVATAAFGQDVGTESGPLQFGSQVTDPAQQTGQPVDLPQESPAPPQNETPPETNPSAPRWETRDGLEEVAKSYYEQKQTYNTCRAHGDTNGMRRAEHQMIQLASQLATFQKKQSHRDHSQDVRLNKHSELVWKHESELNNSQNGLMKRVGDLERDGNASLPIINGFTWKLNRITWWLLILTIIVVLLFIALIVAIGARQMPPREIESDIKLDRPESEEKWYSHWRGLAIWRLQKKSDQKS